MREVSLTLEFACATCAGAVQVDVKCAGVGLFGKAPRAAVAVPCPTCRSINDLIFDPDGVVYRVAPRGAGRLCTMPSLN